MGRFSNPFQSHRVPPTNATTADAPTSALPTPPASTQSSDITLPEGPNEIRNYVRGANKQIQWLQECLAKLSNSDITQVNEIKRALKSTHRGLEKVHIERCPGHGEELEASVGYVVRYAWRTYMSAVKLEERMKGVGKGSPQMFLRDRAEDGKRKDKKVSRDQEGQEVRNGNRDRKGKDKKVGWNREVQEVRGNTKDPIKKDRKVERNDLVCDSRTRDGKDKRGYMNNEVQTVGLPTSEEKMRSEREPPAKSRRYLERDVEELFLMSGALPIEDGATSAPSQTAEADPLDAVTILPRTSSPELPPETPRNLSVVETNPEQIPQPRHEVKRRLQQEEDNSSFELLDPDRVRRGSCNGFMITEMTMRGLQDPSFVLPYLHYMKIHELRCLKEWLVYTGNVIQSQPVSRMEKVLLCMQVLQSGCRYEALAVIHSRSPCQVKESCNEVMQGLLHWHALTVKDQDIGDQAKSLILWGIWDRYCASDGRAGLYFGFNWTQLAKVLVALNVYMGRWRMQGRFATDGPAFAWGKFFEPETQVPDGTETDEEQLCSDLDDESFDGSLC
ncbi:hypothetical protein Ptr902_07221 [Pyrenophora tritici-repentis]|nr:hypothetical protein Alg130_06127 [Pyrenophora tritici-repentis]KAI0609699.1 hypothetical protein TUN205_06069 [Pyrenophora tritici-repentis]KAI0621759.1 hypothetical protein TUN199_06264 [Pyrenophora tritici-repentis]KAI2481426.1 hypothetical protein Ptr902_07221 [Pyrenophora tritici-repentis]